MRTGYGSVIYFFRSVIDVATDPLYYSSLETVDDFWATLTVGKVSHLEIVPRLEAFALARNGADGKLITSV